MLDLDIRTADIVSRELGGGPDLADITFRQAIDIYTVRKLRETLKYATENSVFYGELEGVEDILAKPDDEFMEAFRQLPFTTPEDLRERDKDLLCVSPSEISRIVTMNTSGTTGKPKRIYFTEEDQQLTVDYFNHGMRLIVDSSDKVLILMPAAVPGSIGLLLGQGLRDLGAEAVEYGIPDLPKDTKKLLKLIKDEGITSVVALPRHMIALAREAEAAGEDIQLRSVLLSAEYVPSKTAMLLEEIFGCMVFEHYGMTEMGLGCAVSCGYGKGYHIREADLYVELINPLTGETVRPGSGPEGYSNFGEIVFTTLTRKGMPFIRYRTGDFSRWIEESCPCGSVLKRLDKVAPREEEKNL
ncbi:MAG: AMP-binding protein [Clostridiales bacterium]|nr:AMP-binding protein [Clostridiales bacterium]MDD7034921.1 AMP-binding protein [Bacillota bacterium]MDY2920318.1 AMP-binding protein [Lentihominibacter sp.]